MAIISSNSSITLAVTYTTEDWFARAKQLAAQLHLPIITEFSTEYDYVLIISEKGVALQNSHDKKLKPLSIDFLQGKSLHRLQYGGGKGQLIAKACGIKASQRPAIIDATAGLGSDAFVLASLGCQVQLIERNPIIYTLLDDALQRLKIADQQSIEKNMHLIQQDACDFLSTIQAPFDGVIYLDPMHPDRVKSALVKKEMRIIRDIVGNDGDDEKLFTAALRCQPKRLVVKRPRIAKTITDLKPSLQFIGRSTRCDVYLNIQ